MKTSTILFVLCLLGTSLFSSCKEDRLMRKQSGVWEITNWQGTTYDNGVIITDTTINDMGYLSLYDSGLNGLNQTHYKLSYSPPCWTKIANPNTGLDSYEDYCWWEIDPEIPNRFALKYIGSFGEIIMMMFTLEKVSRTEQKLTYISSTGGTNSTMASKDVFTMKRVKK